MFCKCDIVISSFTTHVVNCNDAIIVIKNVLCEECEQCGEKFYTDDVAEEDRKIGESCKADDAGDSCFRLFESCLDDISSFRAMIGLEWSFCFKKRTCGII